MSPILLIALAGCGRGNGVLEVDSGLARRAAMGGVPTYSIHVGQRGALRFHAKIGTIDYAVMHDEIADTYEDCGPPIDGGFSWTHRFDSPSAAGQPVRLTVEGLSQQGKRDAMPVGGRLVEGRTPNDDADLRLATATVVLDVYQSAVEFDVRLTEGTPDWGITKLVIKRADGKFSRCGHAGRSGMGFSVTGPDDKGAYHVRYEPTSDEVNRDGVTQAELQVADDKGRITPFATTFPTP